MKGRLNSQNNNVKTIMLSQITNFTFKIVKYTILAVNLKPGEIKSLNIKP